MQGYFQKRILNFIIGCTGMKLSVLDQRTMFTSILFSFLDWSTISFVSLKVAYNGGGEINFLISKMLTDKPAVFLFYLYAWTVFSIEM